MEDSLRLLLESIKDYAIIMLDRNGKVVRWNPGAALLLGYAEEEAVGRGFDLFFTPQDRERGAPAGELRQAAEEGRADGDRWHVRKDGSRLWVSGATTALRDDAGALRGFAMVIQNRTSQKLIEEGRATERRKAEREAERHTGQLRRLAWIATKINTLHEVKAIVDLITREAGQLTGSHQAVTRLFTHEDRGAAIDGEPVDGEGIDRFRGGGGPSDRLGCLSAPLIGRQKEQLGLIQLLDKRQGQYTEADESMLVQLAQMASVAIENARLYQQLQENNRRKDDWIAMLAHELRGPLSPVCNAVQVLMMKEPADQELDRAREVIARQTQHMARIVNDLLDSTRLSRGVMRLRKERIDLSRLLHTAVDDFQMPARKGGVELAIETPETPVWIQGDAIRLTQVFYNLLENALKFTERAGRVDVALVKNRTGEAVVSVRDTGIGMDPAALPALFEPLNQADRGLHRDKGGLGLGLALIRGLTELHGGKVEAHSPGIGRGAVLTVWLPLEEEPAPFKDLPGALPPPTRGYQVLIVEDNRDSADSLRMLLELLGHDVRVAYTGPDGVAMADQWRPDVILCDIGLPGLDGYGVASELRRRSVSKKARLIAITGYGSDEDQLRARKAGFHYHLTKPADPDVLIRLLDQSA